jgi:hypothetical protein
MPIFLFFLDKKTFGRCIVQCIQTKVLYIRIQEEKKRIKEGQYGGINYIATRASTPLKLLSFTLKNPVLLSQSVHDFNWRFFFKMGGKISIGRSYVVLRISQPSVFRLVFVINNFVVFSVGRSVRMQYLLRRHLMFPLRTIVSLCFRLHTFFYYITSVVL